MDQRRIAKKLQNRLKRKTDASKRKRRVRKKDHAPGEPSSEVKEALAAAIESPLVGQRVPSTEALACVKMAVRRGGDAAATEANDIILGTYFCAGDSQVRMVALAVLDCLFQRSQVVRQCLVASIHDFVECGLGIRIGEGGGGRVQRAPSSLPSPQEYATQLHDKTLKLLVAWQEAFASWYPQLRVACRYLSEVHGIRLPEVCPGAEETRSGVGRPSSHRRPPTGNAQTPTDGDRELSSSHRLVLARYRQAAAEMRQSSGGIKEVESVLEELETQMRLLVPTMEDELDWESMGGGHNKQSTGSPQETTLQQQLAEAVTLPVPVAMMNPEDGKNGDDDDDDDDGVDWEAGDEETSSCPVHHVTVASMSGSQEADIVGSANLGTAAYELDIEIPLHFETSEHNSLDTVREQVQGHIKLLQGKLSASLKRWLQLTQDCAQIPQQREQLKGEYTEVIQSLEVLDRRIIEVTQKCADLHF